MTADLKTTITEMAVDPVGFPTLEILTESELEALLNAAAWYAKYHERMISELADDASALAMARRTRHQELYNGLAKLGVRLRRPAGIDPSP